LSGTAQLASNALAKVVPGGAVAAGATYFQMLSVVVPRSTAATALAASGFISNMVLFSLPAVALMIAAASAPIPKGLLPVAVAGSVLFAFMFVVVLVLVKFDSVLLFVGRIVARVIGWLARKFDKEWTSTAQGWLDRRDEVVEALGDRWLKALATAVLNWLLDYAVLVAALFAIGASPRPSLVLVAFAGSSVLAMIPLTPGGLGFVEVGLSAMLIAAGVPANDATLATLIFRLFQFWLPIPAGAVAYIMFKRRYGRPADLPVREV
ncbi:MAG: flippase-like domain-containing protein, partial [Acidimicrobiia bacterium]|nr:flippase-like domain-containing protein [Acidimicrobiia bacterium]